ncbi:MAG: peptidase M14, partial [Deltaproteobacteria bacterium]
LNFSELQPGTTLGRLGGSAARQLVVDRGAPGLPPSDYFSYHNGDIRLTRRAIPSMLTKDERAFRLDCLGYLMHRIDRSGTLRE